MNYKLLTKLYEEMFQETSGYDIDHDRYSDEEIGEQLFQLRCHWLKNKRRELISDENVRQANISRLHEGVSR